MGANVSQLESVDLKDLTVYESLVSEMYTVQRNPKNSTDPPPGTRGAKEDDGWKIPREPVEAWAAAHATFAKGSNGEMTWRFHMINGREVSEPEFVYGWRRLGTFWPTHMKTWEERDAWTAQLLALVETLKTPLQKQEQEQEEPQVEANAKANASVVWGRAPLT